MPKQNALAIGIDPARIDFTRSLTYFGDDYRSYRSTDRTIEPTRVQRDKLLNRPWPRRRSDSHCGSEVKPFRLRGDRCRIAGTSGTPGPVRKDHQPHSQTCAVSKYLFQYFAGRYSGGGATLDRPLTGFWITRRHPLCANTGPCKASTKNHASCLFGRTSSGCDFRTMGLCAKLQHFVVRSRSRPCAMTIGCRLRDLADQGVDAGEIVEVGDVARTGPSTTCIGFFVTMHFQDGCGEIGPSFALA